MGSDNGFHVGIDGTLDPKDTSQGDVSQRLKWLRCILTFRRFTLPTSLLTNNKGHIKVPTKKKINAKIMKFDAYIRPTKAIQKWPPNEDQQIQHDKRQQPSDKWDHWLVHSFRASFLVQSQARSNKIKKIKRSNKINQKNTVHKPPCTSCHDGVQIAGLQITGACGDTPHGVFNNVFLICYLQKN